MFSSSQSQTVVRSFLKESLQDSIVLLMRKWHLIRWPENLILLPVYVTLYSVWQHDSGTECTPGESKNLGQKENGNYIMYARATSGDKLNNNKFSLCSIRNISQVLEKKRNNCFVGMYIFQYSNILLWVFSKLKELHSEHLRIHCLCFMIVNTLLYLLYHIFINLSIPQSIFLVAI